MLLGGRKADFEKPSNDADLRMLKLRGFPRTNRGMLQCYLCGYFKKIFKKTKTKRTR